MRMIVLDTNFLMIPIQFKVDIFSEIERICCFQHKLAIYSASVDELENIIKKQPQKSRKAAQFALKLIKAKNIEVLHSRKGAFVDDLIIDSLKKDMIVATQDMVLKKRVLEKGASAIILRQKKYLEIIERKLYK